jgi:hypothetical protein
MFLVVDLLYALAISFTWAWLDRALPRPERPQELATAEPGPDAALET